MILFDKQVLNRLYIRVIVFYNNNNNNRSYHTEITCIHATLTTINLKHEL